jgi:hypothetical protein
VVAGLVAIGACSLALAVGLIVAGPRAAVESSGADSFSRSALGHRAFVDLLRASGVPAVVSRFASGERAGHSSVLVIAEPQLAGDGAREQRLTSMLAAAGTVLLVLPKWTGQGRGREPGWIDGVSPVPAEAVARTLRAAGVSAELSRPRDADAGRCAGAAAGIRWSQPQLLVPRAPSLQARLVCGGGVLFGEMTRPNGQRLFVLSDPDVIANHGLGKGGNAALALEIVERARRRGQPVVVDETLHGHEHVPSLWADLFAFPQLASVIHGGLALLFFIWAGMARFGAPLSVPPALGSGKGILIENTAALLRSAGHSAYTLGRYVDACALEVARALHAPAAGDPGQRRQWLDGVGRRRGAAATLTSLERHVDGVRRASAPSAAVIVHAATRVHRWKEEMIRGADRDPRG